jgi:hypothetical protein
VPTFKIRPLIVSDFKKQLSLLSLSLHFKRFCLKSADGLKVSNAKLKYLVFQIMLITIVCFAKMAIFPHFGEMHVIRQEPLIMHYFNNKRESRAPLLDIGFLPPKRMHFSILD